MSDDGLTWIKHDGGPMPVPGDTWIRVISTDGYAWSEHTASFYHPEYPGEPLDTTWENGRLDMYAIVKPSPSAGVAVEDQNDAYGAPAIDAHYTKYPIQPMEFSLANGLDPAQHTVIKYVVRYRDKGGVRDLRAAIRVLELMIERQESGA